MSDVPRPGSRGSSAAPRPDWLPLDNAAKIYPTASSRLSPVVFRLSARLRAPVRLSALQKAADALVRRCPYFQVHLRRGLFWYYLQRHPETPQVQLLDSLPLEAMPAHGRTEHLLRIRARLRTIAVEFSHILTDGAGGLRFLSSLLAEYLRQCGIAVAARPELLEPREDPDPEEAEDAHRRHFGRGGPGPAAYPPAFHIAERPPRQRYWRILSGRMPASRMRGLAKAMGTTLTEYLAALYMSCLGRLYQAEVHEGRRPASSIVRLEVPVNMRRFFPSATMRNFSLYVSPEVDLRLGHYSLEELASRVHHSMQMELDRRELSRQITRNVGAELRPVVRATPLFVKDILLGWMYHRLSARIYSSVLSNLGRVELPPDMAAHIESFGMVLVPGRVTKKTCTMITYGDELSVTISSIVESRELERLFFTTLASQGIPVSLSED